jgi:ABC-type transporter Mla maintaining outer membrane lipid asymmetry ATPase subunit MlaF
MSKPRTLPQIESLRFESATFGYDVKNPIFDAVTFNAPLDRNIFVTGKAGHGQSTFLKLLAVLVQPQSGSFLINGQNTSEMSFEEFLPYRRRIGYTFDYGGLFANRTLAENIVLPLLYHKTHSLREAEAEAFALAEAFGFKNDLSKIPASASGGLRKLVSILRAFVLRPEMLVMDDPFTGIDHTNKINIIKLINERRESGELKHVFITCRDADWPERFGFETLYVEHGQFRFEPGRHEKVA